MDGSALRFALVVAFATLVVSCGDGTAPGAGPSPLPRAITPLAEAVDTSPVSDVVDCEAQTTIAANGEAVGSTACERVGTGNVVIVPTADAAELFHTMKKR